MGPPCGFIAEQQHGGRAKSAAQYGVGWGCACQSASPAETTLAPTFEPPCLPRLLHREDQGLNRCSGQARPRTAEQAPRSTLVAGSGSPQKCLAPSQEGEARRRRPGRSAKSRAEVAGILRVDAPARRTYRIGPYKTAGSGQGQAEQHPVGWDQTGRVAARRARQPDSETQGRRRAGSIKGASRSQDARCK